MKRKKKTRSQQIKSRARRTLKGKLTKERRKYVVDTSAIINKFLPVLIKKGLRGKIIIPNAVMAELENLANKGKEEGFIGLEEITNLHKLKTIRVHFQGIRPKEIHIKYARSGEIDALIREIAKRNKATLITADLVQAKSCQAYGLEVIFLRTKPIKIKKRSLFSFLRRR
ncbi:MAG: PIN domain-containing protein [Nanoarchaeota archaeon]